MTIFSLCFLISCTDNLNFDEINLNVDPVLTVPLVYFELDQNDFFDNTTGLEIPLVTDTSDFRVFKSSAIRNDLVNKTDKVSTAAKRNKKAELASIYYGYGLAIPGSIKKPELDQVKKLLKTYFQH